MFQSYCNQSLPSPNVWEEIPGQTQFWESIKVKFWAICRYTETGFEEI